LIDFSFLRRKAALPFLIADYADYTELKRQKVFMILLRNLRTANFNNSFHSISKNIQAVARANTAAPHNWRDLRV
jgi:hypothetical protein